MAGTSSSRHRSSGRVVSGKARRSVSPSSRSSSYRSRHSKSSAESRRERSLARFEALSSRHETPLMKKVREESEERGASERVGDSNNNECCGGAHSSPSPSSTRSTRLSSRSRSRSRSRSASPPSRRSHRSISKSFPRHLRLTSRSSSRHSSRVDSHRDCTYNSCEAGSSRATRSSSAPRVSRRPEPILYSPHRTKSLERRRVISGHNLAIAFSAEDSCRVFDLRDSSEVVGCTPDKAMRSKAATEKIRHAARRRLSMRSRSRSRSHSRSPSPTGRSQVRRPLSPVRRRSSRSPSPDRSRSSSRSTAKREYYELNGRVVYYDKAGRPHDAKTHKFAKVN